MSDDQAFIFCGLGGFITVFGGAFLMVFGFEHGPVGGLSAITAVLIWEYLIVAWGLWLEPIDNVWTRLARAFSWPWRGGLAVIHRLRLDAVTLRGSVEQRNFESCTPLPYSWKDARGQSMSTLCLEEKAVYAVGRVSKDSNWLVLSARTSPHGPCGTLSLPLVLLPLALQRRARKGQAVHIRLLLSEDGERRVKEDEWIPSLTDY